jgi:hypothetical protein
MNKVNILDPKNQWIQSTQVYLNLNIQVYAHKSNSTLGALVNTKTLEILIQGTSKELGEYLAKTLCAIEEKALSELSEWEEGRTLITFSEKVTKAFILKNCANKECFTIYSGGRTKTSVLERKGDYLYNGSSKLEFKASDITGHDNHFRAYRNRYYVST